ncbi:MAG: DUF2975 domain-containing protein [Saprospiraceae bacterium]|nr:DUF2975 domain-containing protein [Saprospiraceae bacterium]
MKTKNPFIITFMHVIFMIVFIGLALAAGTMLTHYIISLFIGPEPQGPEGPSFGLGIGNVYEYSIWHYHMLASYIVSIILLKTIMAYQVVAIFQHLDLNKPFQSKVVSKIRNIGYLAVLAGILSIFGNAHDKWLMKRGVEVAYDWDANEILFFAGIIFVLGLIFKKGAEFQSENELTV